MKKILIGFSLIIFFLWQHLIIRKHLHLPLLTKLIHTFKASTFQKMFLME